MVNTVSQPGETVVWRAYVFDAVTGGKLPADAADGTCDWTLTVMDGAGHKDSFAPIGQGIGLGQLTIVKPPAPGVAGTGIHHRLGSAGVVRWRIIDRVTITAYIVLRENDCLDG